MFPVYALMIPFAFFFNVFTVNCGPAFFRGETHPSNSFPSMTTVFCLVVFGTAMMEWHRLFREYKELLAKLETAGLVLIGLSLVVRVLAGRLVHGYFGGGAAEPVADQPVQGPLHSRGESVIER